MCCDSQPKSGLQSVGGQETVSRCRSQCHSPHLHGCVDDAVSCEVRICCAMSLLGGGSGLRLPDC